ncbi:MAG: glycerophosphodiester phosphodiesterase family protein [Pseudomonadota bacterium]
MTAAAKSAAALALAAALLSLVGFNASFLSPAPDGAVKILAHRGVHQTFRTDGVTNETCTATRIHPPTHEFLENTLDSVAAAFAYGADMVEIDIRPTKDGDFAVFHDHTLDCRTNATGRTSDRTMAELKALDIGYGYTADGGASFPFRGAGVGLTPSLDEMLRRFPGRAFMINAKSNAGADAEALQAYFTDRGLAPSAQSLIWAGPRFVERWRAIGGETPATTRREVKTCAKQYVLYGWSGYVPPICAGFGLVAPADYTWLYWGWPRKTLARFDRAGMRVFLAGPLGGPTQGVDDPALIARIPRDYAGWITTDKIEVIGPAIRERSP